MAERYGSGSGAGTGLGLVIVNLQRTPFDAVSSLRIYAKIDDVMALLMKELGLCPRDHEGDWRANLPAVPPAAVVEPDVFRIPFSPDGQPSAGETSLWDLRVGAKVRLTGGPYEGDVGRVVEKNGDGHYRVQFKDSIHPELKMRRKNFSLWLGCWWVADTIAGRALCPGASVPLVNVSDEEFAAVRAAKRAQDRSRAHKAGDLAQYAQMLKAGVPLPAVEAKMGRDGVDLGKYRRMLKVGVPASVVKAQMAKDKLPEEVAGAVLAAAADC